jgi:threonine/homoserine/homoserine lactone efflux protein
VIGIVVLAFMVNLVELVCSAGLPAIFTQVLTLNDLPVWQYYGYILVYIFFFMVDDLFVFVVSMKTLELTGLTTRYTRYSRLVGGVLMLLVGILLVLKPEYLMFS